MNTNLVGDMVNQTREQSATLQPQLLTKAEVATLIRKSQRTVECWHST